MNAWVITHSSNFEPRAEAVAAWLEEQGIKTTRVFSDFDHIRKKTLVRREPDHIYLHMDPYDRNLSVRRIRSISAFARDVGKLLSGRQIDLLYVLLPANSLAPVAEKIKRVTGAKVVFDIIDLWPESLPMNGVRNLPPIRAWKEKRDRHLGCADLIFTECDLYRELLDLPPERTKTLYWHSANPSLIAGNVSDNVLDLAYIGAISHIIDIDSIAELVRALSERTHVRVHVIGEGISRELFLEALGEAGAEVVDHGAVYDEEKKAAILSTCVFGLNFMMPQVKVGLTMKTLDYLANGLPLLNNIEGDTWDLIEEYDAGINVPREDPRSVVERILTMAHDPMAGRDAARLYREKFTEEHFRNTLESYLKPLLEVAPAMRNNENESPCAGGKRISVAMAAYNGEAYIQEQLDSILSQLCEDDEVVISVDPSEDKTFALVCEAAAGDARIRVLEGTGEGVVRNVERALRECAGQIIFLSDQDDIWLPGKVEKIRKFLEQDTLVLHDARIVGADLTEIAPSFMQWRGSRKGKLANLWKNSYIGCCMAFRRELLDVALPFPENVPMHDQWLGLMAEKYGSVRILRTPLILYRRHENNATDAHHANVATMLKWRSALLKEMLRR